MPRHRVRFCDEPPAAFGRGLRRRRSRRGLTLVELLLSMVLGAMLMSTVVFVFANLASNFSGQRVTDETFGWDEDGDGDASNDYIPMTPAYGQLPPAFALQAEIYSLIQATRSDQTTGVPYASSSVYVISSDDGRELPPADYGNGLTTLSFMDSSVAQGKVCSNEQFYNLMSADTSIDFTNAEGYSIFFVSMVNVLDLAVHVRRTTTSDGGDYIYRVSCYSEGNFLTSLSYAYGISVEDDEASPVYPGARTISLVSDSSWGRSLDLGTQFVLPDPSVLPYQMSADDGDLVRTCSRFAMFLPVKP